MGEPKLQGFPLNYTKACSPRREKPTLFDTKSMRWPLFRKNHLIARHDLTAPFGDDGALTCYVNELRRRTLG